MGPYRPNTKACKAAWERRGPWRADLGDDVTRQGVSPNGRLFVPGGLVLCPGLGWPDAAPVFNHRWGNGQLILAKAQSF